MKGTFQEPVNDPERCGIVGFDSKWQVSPLQEKPSKSLPRYAVAEIYFHDAQAVGVAEDLKPSVWGELKITDVDFWYPSRGQLRTENLGRRLAWLHTGTHEGVLDAANSIQTIKHRQGLKVACPGTVGFRLGYIGAPQVERLAQELGNSSHDAYFRRVLAETLY